MNERLPFLLRAAAISAFTFVLIFSSNAQEFRAFDGWGNNQENPQWGAAGANQLQYTTVGFTDGISMPAGADRPNPRIVSNAIFHQSNLLPDEMDLSDYAWVWGQFIDHDITLVGENHSETINITVPVGDDYFDPGSTGTVQIPMLRSNYDESTGTGVDNPRAFPNEITAFIDASAVYGSDLDRSYWLRSFEDGKLKMSEGDLLPYNTLTGEVGGEIDPNSPEMAMPMPFVQKWFVAGDVRANENPSLIAMHTLFVREHNRLCDELKEEHPGWTDEQLYQHARRIVGGLMQSIVYEEWLPSMGVHIPHYSGYDANVNPGIMNVFSAAAYRYGHTVINGTILRMNNEGDIIPQGNLALRDAFFNPEIIPSGGGLSPLFIGMATQVEQGFDCKMINDLRNFLFGAPGAGGLDLASLNINRGRERGLADYNTIRQDFGLPPVERFADLSSNPWLNDLLEATYLDINDLDMWVAMLAEDRMSNALFGETVMEIMAVQFTALRDGDRFYYENDPALSTEEMIRIRLTRLVDIIERNTDAEGLQRNVFFAEPHSPVASYDAAAHPFSLQVFPNPTTGLVNAEVNMEKPTSAVVEIHDLSGKVLMQTRTYFHAGSNIARLETADLLGSGMYFLVVRAGDQVDRTTLVRVD